LNIILLLDKCKFIYILVRKFKNVELKTIWVQLNLHKYFEEFLKTIWYEYVRPFLQDYLILNKELKWYID